MIECKICFKIFKNLKSLSGHIKLHKIKIKDYYDKYLKKDNEGKCYCGKNTTFIDSKKGYLKYCSYKCSTNDQNIKEKKVRTIQIKNIENPNRLKEIQKKYIQNYFKNHGVENPMQSKEVQEKFRQTCKNKYGVDHPSQSKKIKEKIKYSNFIKYGIDNPFKDVKKIKKSLVKKYGVDHFFKTNQGRLTCRVKTINRIENQKLNNEPLCPFIGNTERLFLNEIQNNIIFNIIRNDSSFRYIVGRFPDGHIPQLKLFIQFDEQNHFLDKEQKNYKQDDINCTLQLASLGYIVWRVSEKNWLENKQLVIEQFKQLIGGIRC